MRHRPLAGLLVALATLAVLAPVPAQAQYFGRNKVQYKSFDFRIIKTEHFDVYYYPEEREAALDAARMVERAYARISRLLQHEFEERKPLIVYASHSDFQQTNTTYGFIDESTGGFTDIKDRMVLPFTGSYEDFERVLVHELVHAFQYDIIFRRTAGTDVSPFGFRPTLWFMEGMAEYLTLGQVDAFTEGWLRDAVLSGYIRDIEEMSRRDDYLSYRFGQALWAYVGGKWGDEVVGILMQKAPRVGIPRAFESTLGITLGELSQEWMTSLRQKYLAQVTEHDRADRIAQRLTRHDQLEDPWYFAPAISPDGRWMTILTQEDGFLFDLWLADAHTGELEQRLVKGSADADFHSLRYLDWSASFSPDGRRLAYGLESEGKHVLVIYDLEKRKETKRLDFGMDGVWSPSWSPDGQRIAFAGSRGGISDLYITTVDGQLRRLTDDRHADLFPSWSPDGRAIAFSTDRGAGTSFERLTFSDLQVALYHLDDGRIELVAPHEGADQFNPVWAPDSRSLVWASDRSGISNLYLYDFDRRELSRITDLLTGVTSVTYGTPTLTWARNDPRLLFVHFEGAGYNVYAVDDPRLLERRALEDEAPAPPVVARAEPAPVQKIDTISLGLPAGASETVASTSYYREGNAFRPSNDAPPAPAETTGPLSVLALLDSATLSLPDTTDFVHEDYGVHFTPDVVGRPTIGASVGGYYGNGLYGGSYIFLSDILGDHNIMLSGSVNGSFSDANVLAGYWFLKRRANLGVVVQQTPLYRYYGRGDPFPQNGELEVADVFLRDLVRSASGMLSYPLSSFKRIELGAAAAYFRRDILYRGFNVDRQRRLDEDRTIGSLWYAQPSASLVFDNSLFGWTGPVAGRRYRAQVGQYYGDFEFTEGLLDFRNYMNFKQKVVLATRLLTLYRTGEDAHRFAQYWGGSYFLRGYDGDSFEVRGEECELGRETALYGCAVRDQLIGSSAAILNMELRFPIITELQIGFLGSFPPVDAVLFFDGGLAFDDRLCSLPEPEDIDGCGNPRDVSIVWDRKAGEDPMLVREPLFSTGFGLRFNVYYTVLRLDYAFPLSRLDRSGVFSVSFGPSF